MRRGGANRECVEEPAKGPDSQRLGVCPSRARASLYRPAISTTKAAARPRRTRQLFIRTRPARAEAVAIETALEQSRSVQPGQAGLPWLHSGCQGRQGWLFVSELLLRAGRLDVGIALRDLARSEQRSVVKDLVAVRQHSLPRGTFHDVVP